MKNKAQQVSLSLRSDILQKFDTRRGIIKRSSMIQFLIEQYLNGDFNLIEKNSKSVSALLENAKKDPDGLGGVASHID